jgi:hypothetical protein
LGYLTGTIDAIMTDGRGKKVRKIVGMLTAVVLGVGLAVLGVATPASAKPARLESTPVVYGQ